MTPDDLAGLGRRIDRLVDRAPGERAEELERLLGVLEEELERVDRRPDTDVPPEG